MGKFKKKSISDVKLSKPTFTKKQNPFEVHINREKFKVIGKKSNFDKGLPGVARAKAINKVYYLKLNLFLYPCCIITCYRFSLIPV